MTIIGEIKPYMRKVPFREGIVSPQIGDIVRRGKDGELNIFASCIDCGKGHWMTHYAYKHSKNMRCRDCGMKLAHLHRKCNNKHRSIESKFPMRLSNAIRANIRDALHRKGGNKKERGWESLVGYSIKDLMKHLQEQFVDGMSWGNYGKWHIDHIIPVSKFNFTSTDDFDFKRCWALSNLQPLWASENVRKHAKYSKPFQPSLKLENKNAKGN